MATKTFTVEDVKLTSGWTIKITQGSGSTPSSYSNSGSNTVKTTRTFSFAALPKGSIINSAYISCSRRGSNSGSLRRVDGKNDSVNSTANITIDKTRITAGGTLEIEFVYQATAYSYSTSGYYNGSTWWENIVLTVDYTGYTACTAPTAISINNSTATPSETRTLSWSGAQAGLNNAISKYEIYRATSAGGTYTKLGETNAATRSLAVTAPSTAGSYFYKVKTIGAVSGYSSGLSSAYASVSVSVTEPSVPTNLTLAPASQYPAGASILSWSAATPGTSNPVTGYNVYQSTSADGTYSFLANVSTNSYSVITPQTDSLYFKVMTVGTYLDSGLSEYVTLTVDMSSTSTFTVNDTIDAGEELTVTFTSNTDKAHTIVFSIGSYSHTIQSAANAGSEDFTPPLTWLNAMPDSRTASMSVTVTTAGAGTIAETITLRCPDNIVPTGMDGTATPSSNTVPAAWNAYLSGLSAAVVTLNIAATAQYGASIVRYMIDGPGVHAEGDTLPLTVTSGTLSKGNQTFTLAAVDSRGMTGIRQIIINVISYEPPTLKSILSRRADDQGEEEDEGVYVLAEATIQWVSVQGANTASCSVAYREQGASAWITAGTLSNGSLLFGGAITPSDNWEIRYVVTDSLGSSNTYYDIITRAIWEIHVKKGGGAWAFGGVADMDGALKVYGQVAASLGDVPAAVCDMGGDLNDALEPGLYSYTSSYANTPTSAGGCLLVLRNFENQILSQLAFCNSSSKNPYIYARHYYSDGWGAWVQIGSQYGYPYRRSSILNTTANTSSANAWVNTGLTANLTEGHLYTVVSGYTGGRLMGFQLRRSGNAFAEWEYLAETGDRLSCGPVFYCSATQTAQLWVKRNATGQETYQIIDLGVTTT